MTTTTITPAEVPSLDVSDTQPVPLTRMVGVELRKMWDTRAGMWLLIVIAAVTVLVTTAMFIWGNDDDLTFINLMSFAGIPQGVLLPVLAILLVTQEWGQRTGLVTFSLVPHREKVLVAKLTAALIFVLAALAIAVLIAVLLASVSPASDPWQGFEVAMLAKLTLAAVLGAVWGYAFGAALLNSALAIVVYFAVPMVVSIVSAIWASVREKLLWFDLGSSSSLLYEPNDLSGEQWAQIATGTLIWIVLPLAIGVVRILRSEVK
jgi:ABC-2 type transport system permease protein